MEAENKKAKGTGHSLGSALYAHMKYFRNRIAQYEDETEYVDTYGTLLTRCIRAAIKLQELGIGEDDIVSACTHNHRDSCVPFLASTFIGAIPATFDPGLSQTDTISLLRLMEPKIVFITQEALKDFEMCIEKAQVKPAYIVTFGDSKGKYMNFDEFLKPHIREKEFKVYKTSDPKKTAVILFSSGTTGLPKGICVNHYALLEQSGSYREDSLEVEHPETADSVVLVYSTLYWISSVSTLIGSTLRGEAKVLCRNFDGKRFWEIVDNYKITFAFVPPYHITDILHERPKDEVDVSSLKTLLTGSCHVPAQLMRETIEAFPEAFVKIGYGQTEFCGFVSLFNRPEQRILQKKKLTSCGMIFSTVQWKIVDLETEQPVTGPNKKGELRLKSDLHMNGYYKMDSSDAFDSEGYLKTGDVAYYDEDNCLFIEDRVKEMFKYRGWHILPAIVEEVLMGHPAVKEAAVIGIPHPEDGEHPMGLVVLRKGCEDVMPEEIRTFADEKLSDAQKLRAGVQIIDELVRTTTGKIKRKALREMILNNRRIGDE